MSGHRDVFYLATENTETTENLFIFISEVETKDDL